ncbi:Uncharacterised protein [Yersinia enterocolitica]|nr:Uncharacterised protein [Yersinia enterocolitica]
MQLVYSSVNFELCLFDQYYPDEKIERHIP